MKGPRKPRVLIVEDHPGAIEDYNELFADLKRENIEFVGPTIVASHEEAINELASNRHFHFVILDLQIPQKARGREQRIDWGFDLLERCIARDDKPIPSVLIVTGHIANRKQGELLEVLPREFVFGKAISKSELGTTDAEIKNALVRVRICLAKHLEYDDCIELTAREDYLACRVAMGEDDVEGFRLTEPDSTQSSCLEGSPFVSAEKTRVIIATPMLSDGADAAQRFYFAFVSGNREHLRAIERQANQWSLKSAGVSKVHSYWSNETALFYFSVAQPIGTKRKQRINRNVMKRKKKVVDTISAYLDVSSDVSAIIGELCYIDPNFSTLEVAYVRAVLAMDFKPPAKATHLTCKVGAFGVAPDTKKDSPSWKSMLKTFYEAVRVVK